MAETVVELAVLWKDRRSPEVRGVLEVDNAGLQLEGARVSDLVKALNDKMWLITKEEDFARHVAFVELHGIRVPNSQLLDTVLLEQVDGCPRLVARTWMVSRSLCVKSNGQRGAGHTAGKVSGRTKTRNNLLSKPSRVVRPLGNGGAIYVKTLTGKKTSVACSALSTVLDVKLSLQD
jgi:hypothetical protein